MNEFIDAIMQILKLNSDNFFIIDLIKEELKKVHEDDRKEFLTILFNEPSTYNETDRFNKAIEKYQSNFKKRIFLIDKEEFAKELELKLEMIDYIAYKNTNGINEYRSKIDSLIAKDIKNQENESYFDSKQLYVISTIGSISKCLSLILEGYGAFKTRVLLILGEIEKQKTNNQLGINTKYAIENLAAKAHIIGKLDIRKV